MKKLMQLFWVFIISVLAGIIYMYYPEFLFLILALAVLLAFTYGKREWVFFIFLLVLPVDRFYFPFFYRIKLYQIFLVILIATEMLYLIFKKEKEAAPVRYNMLDMAVVLLLVGKIYTLAITIDTMVTVKSIMLNTVFVFLYFYIRSKAGSMDPRKMLDLFIRFSAVYILFGFAEFIVGKLGLIEFGHSSDGIYVYAGRPASVFREPDWLGGYLTFIIGLTFPFLHSKKRTELSVYKWNRSIFYLAMLMSLLVVVRSAWLGIIVGIFAVIMMGKDRRKSLGMVMKLLIILLIIMIGLSFVYPDLFMSIKHRFVSIFAHFTGEKVDSAADVRLNSYEVIIDYIKQNPMIGYGSGAWEVLSDKHKYINPSLSTNNILLTAIFEGGAVGVAIFLFFITAVLRMLGRASRFCFDDVSTRYANGMIIAVIASLVAAVFNDITLTGFYWAFMAMFNNYIGKMELKKAEMAEQEEYA